MEIAGRRRRYRSLMRETFTHDAAEPGPDGGAALEAIHAHEGLKKCLLDAVPSVLRVAHHASSHAEQSSPVTAHQLLVARAVAPAESGEQFRRLCKRRIEGRAHRVSGIDPGFTAWRDREFRCLG